MTTIAARPSSRVYMDRAMQPFYVRMAATFILVAVAGFVPTYWTPMARGTLQATPLIHLHASLFFGWLILFFVQTLLASSGRVSRHRAMGVFGVSLATGMLFVGLATTIQGMQRATASGFGAADRSFAIVSVSGILLFVGLLAAALLYVRDLDVHRRLMLTGTVSLLQAPIGRLFMVARRPPGAQGPPPVAATIGAGLATDLLIVVAMVHDRRTRGRVHPAYWVGGAIVLAVQVLRVPLAETRAWAHVADWLVAILA
jgi:hypothetical protein